MISKATSGAGVTVAVGGASVAAAVGDPELHLVAYALTTLLGAVTYYQADKRLVADAIGTIILGILGGVALSQVVLTLLAVWTVGIPLDLAAWFMWTKLLFPWAAVVFLMLTGYFVVGMLDLLR